jgi:hypothetical protein
MTPVPVFLTTEPPSAVALAVVVVLLLVIAVVFDCPGSDWRRRGARRTGGNNPERDEP